MAILSKVIFLSVIGVMLISCGGSSGDSTEISKNNPGGNPVSNLGAASLNWLPPTENIDSTNLNDLTGYKIYYGEQADNLSQTISVDSINLSSYVIENLNPNTTYYFSITAVNSQDIESTYSNVVSKVIK